MSFNNGSATLIKLSKIGDIGWLNVSILSNLEHQVRIQAPRKVGVRLAYSTAINFLSVSFVLGISSAVQHH